MPERPVHLPFAEGDAKQVGRRLFRKQLLPLGSIEHEGEKLDFTPEYLAKLAADFTAGKRDQVPFVLVDDANRHVSDPEKYRGEVKSMEVGGDGLYVTLELSEDGTKLVEANPKLGVSARIDRTDPENHSIEHVAGTLDPVVKGQRPWEKVALSKDAPEASDLSGATYSVAPVPKLSDLSESDREALKALVAKVSKNKDTTDLSDEEVERTLAKILADAEEDEKPKPDPKVELSDEQKRAIELAESKAKDAERLAREVQAELATERFERKRDALVEAGVPPAIVELAAPVLKGEKKVIELSNGTKIDAGDTVEQILAECKGMIDFSVIGAGEGPEGSQEAEAKAAAEKWAQQQSGQKAKAS